MKASYDRIVRLMELRGEYLMQRFPFVSQAEAAQASRQAQILDGELRKCRLSSPEVYDSAYESLLMAALNA